jgi:hypothetical protein
MGWERTTDVSLDVGLDRRPGAPEMFVEDLISS